MRWTYSFLLSGACCCGGKLPVSDEFVLSLEKLTTIFLVALRESNKLHILRLQMFVQYGREYCFSNFQPSI